MTDTVLDASAILALLLERPGWAIVEAALPRACLSSVALAEVVARLGLAGMPEAEIETVAASLGLPVAPFDAARAKAAGRLVRRLVGTQAGAALSTSDLASLALADELAATLLTASGVLASASAGVSVQLVR